MTPYKHEPKRHFQNTHNMYHFSTPNYKAKETEEKIQNFFIRILSKFRIKRK